MQIINEDNINIYNRRYNIIQESRKEAKQLLQQGKLSQEEFDTIAGIDPTDQGKYTGWLSRVYVNGQERDIDKLRNTIEEFDAFVRKGILKDQKSNIQSYKTFEDLYNTVQEINKTETTSSKKELSGDFDVVVDNEDIRIVVPYTHEASRKLGMTPTEEGGFAFRDCGDGSGKKDSAWCTTYATSTHWDDYYYNQYVDFFYTLIKSDRLKNELIKNGFKPKHFVVALARITLNDGMGERLTDDSLIKTNSDGVDIIYDAYDGTDSQMHSQTLEIWMNIVGIK